MLLSFLVSSLVISIIILPSTSAQNGHDIYDKITDPTKRAEFVLSTLQTWYNAKTGLWETAGWWNAANIMTTVGDFAKADRKNKRLYNLAVRVFANTLIQAPSMNPQPGFENQKPGGTANSTFTPLCSGYTKSLKPDTNEPLTMYPPNWRKHSGYHLDSFTFPVFTSSLSDTEKTRILTTPDPADWIDGFYDDDLWWALAWINAYDVTLQSAYLNLAEGIFLAVAKVWPSHCFHGGIYWSYEKTYVNAIANELFFSTAAHLATRVEESKRNVYITWAERSISWFIQSGMINTKGTINDGLTETCQNNGMTTWSYNQGVILGGLVELHRATQHPSYLLLASRIAHAAIAHLIDDNGVLHDPCEPGCGADGTQFKGVFMRNLWLLHEAAPDDAYVDFVKKNAESIWRRNRIGTVLSVNWAGPFVSPGNASTQSSGLDTLVAAVAVG